MKNFEEEIVYIKLFVISITILSTISWISLFIGFYQCKLNGLLISTYLDIFIFFLNLPSFAIGMVVTINGLSSSDSDG